MAVKTNYSKNGKDYYRITRTIGKKTDGSSIKKEFYGSNKSDAENKAEEYISSLKNGNMPDKKDLSVGELIDIYLYTIRINDENLKPSSFSKYEGINRNYIIGTEFSLLKIFYAKKANVQKYYNELSEQGKTYSQIRNLNKVVKGAFEYALEEGWVLRNPCVKISIPKTQTDKFDELEDDNDDDFFNFDEIDKIIEECNRRIKNNDDHYLPYLIMFCLGTCLRQGEALGLQKRFLLDELVKVRKELTKVKKFKDKKCVGYEYKLLKPKTPSSIRNVDLTKHVNSIMKKYIEITKTKYFKNGLTFNNDSLIFTTSICSVIDQSNLTKEWNKFLIDINVTYRKWHRLRAAGACLMFKEGVDLKTVQQILGHVDLNTTAQIYLFVFPETRKDKINYIDKILSREKVGKIRK